jgi:hypothetical protein
VDVERAFDQIDALIERRHVRANTEQQITEDLWKESTERAREKRRRENAAAWYGHHDHMRALHSSLAAEHARKAAALQLEEPGAGGGLAFMARCAAFKPDGTPCQRIVNASQTYCFSHDPERAEQRKRNAAKAGKAVGSTEIRALKTQLADLYAAVLDGTTEPKVGAVAAQIANVRARLVETEKKIEESEEMSTRRAEEAYGLLLNSLEERLPRDEFERAVRALSTPEGVIDM